MFSISDKIRSFMLPLKIFEGLVPFKQIDHLMPKEGTIIDLGCGEGFYSTYLARIKSRKVIGIDNNKKSLKTSKKSNLKFTYGDIREFFQGNLNGVLISDVLHHLSFPDQDKILHNITKSIRSGGVLIIKEIDTKEFIRSRLSRFWDFVYFPKDKIYYSNSDEMLAKLSKLDFNVKIFRPSRILPGSTTLYFAKKS